MATTYHNPPFPNPCTSPDSDQRPTVATTNSARTSHTSSMLHCRKTAHQIEANNQHTRKHENMRSTHTKQIRSTARASHHNAQRNHTPSREQASPLQNGIRIVLLECLHYILKSRKQSEYEFF